MLDLSIIIPCYNYAHFLKASLDSILNQDYHSFEIILIDDGSTDATPQLGSEYAKRFPQVRFIRLEKNVGIFEANRIGGKEAKGEFIHYFSSDDLYFPGFISKVLNFFRKHPNLNLICTDIAYFNDGSEKMEPQHLLKEGSAPAFFFNQELPKLCKERGFRVAGASSVLRRELFARYGALDPRLENISDWFLFHRIALNEGVGYIPETLVAIRRHDNTYTSAVKRDKKRRRKTFHHLLNQLNRDPTLRKKFQEAGLLDFIFRELKWKLYLRPYYAPYWLK